MKNFEGTVLRALKEYNRCRSPEATATLVEIDDDELILDFEGPFCRTCGTYDYLEDFIYELKRISDIGIKIASYENLGLEKIRVRYAIGSKGKKD